MADYKRGGGYGDKRGGGFGGKRDFGGSRGGSFGGGSRGSNRGDDREFKMHKAICTDCGDACEVPFRPTGDKPVLCKNCFVDKRDFNPSNFKQQTRRSDKPERTEAAPDRRVDDLKKELANVSAKLDAVLEILNSLTAKKTTKSKAKKDADESETE